MISKELEQKILGNAIMNDEAALILTENLKTEEVFTTDLNKDVFKAICGIFLEGTILDPILVANRAKNYSKTSENELFAYCMELAAMVTGTSDQIYLVRELVDIYLKRALRIKGLEISQSAENDSHGSALILEGVQKLDDLLNQNKGTDEMTLKEQIEETKEAVRKASEPGQLIGLPTGLNELDRVTGGMQRGQLITIAGRPGMGKTALAAAVVLENVQRGTPSLFFTREMTSQEIIKRLVAMRSDLDMNDLFIRQMDRGKVEYFNTEADKIGQFPLYIDETSSNLTELIFSIKRHVMRFRVRLVVIDYLQLLGGLSGKKYAGDTQQFTEITRELKQLAKKLDLPIILLSQLNRDVESRPNKVPRLSDLKQTGGIEEDSNVVLLAYRPEYYGIDYFPTKGEAVPEFAEGRAEIIIAKNRSGGTGFIRVDYVGSKVLFRDNVIESDQIITNVESKEAGMPF